MLKLDYFIYEQAVCMKAFAMHTGGRQLEFYDDHLEVDLQTNYGTRESKYQILRETNKNGFAYSEN